MRAWAAVRHRWWLILALLAVGAYVAWLSHGLLNDAKERRASRTRIEDSANEAKDLAQQVKDQNIVILRIAQAIDTATSPAAQDKSNALIAGIIADLRRSIDCTAIYFAGSGERPAACADVTARIDALRAGLDPFVKPPNPAPTGAPSQ